MAPQLPGRTKVLIVGGGPVGLVVSSLLSQSGLENCVVERRAETQRAPAAHVLRRRPMEILDSIGVGDEVRTAASAVPLDFITWCVTLGGPEIGRLDLRPLDASNRRGPEPWTNCPQNVLEPILLRNASERREARVVLGAECCEIEQRDDGVVAHLRFEDGAETQIAAEWVVAADGAGSPVRRALGISMEGLGALARFHMVHFEADLEPWTRARSGPIYWLMNPEAPGGLIVHDPKRSHVFMTPDHGTENEEQGIPARLASALDVPTVPKILSIDAWSPHVQVASRYVEGRVALVGDAAHRFPPTGGLGLNTGIQEAKILAEKLVRTFAGEDPARLLAAYEAECRPAAQANANESFENMKRLAEVSQVLGEWPDRAGLEERLATLTEVEQQQLAQAIEAQRSHFLSDGVAPGPGSGSAPTLGIFAA